MKIKKYLIVIYEKIKDKNTDNSTNELKDTSFVNKSFKLKKLAPAIAGTDK